MAELGIQIRVNSDAVQAGFEAALAASKNLSTGIGADAKKASASIDDIANQAKKVAEALHRFESANGIRQQGAAAADAAFQFTQLKARVAEAEAAGVKLGPSVSASLGQIGAAVQNVSTQLAAAKNSIGDFTSRGQLLSMELSGAAASAGSLTGMMGQLAQSGAGVAKGLGTVGVAANAVIESFKAGYAAGEQLTKMFPRLAKAMDMSGPIAGLITGVDNAGKAFDTLGFKGQSAIGKINDAKRRMAQSEERIGNLVPEIGEIAEAAEKAAAKIKGMEDALKDAAKEGVTFDAFAVKNAEGILRWQQNLAEAGVELKELPKDLQLLVEKARAATLGIQEFGHAVALSEDSLVGMAATIKRVNDALAADAIAAAAAAAARIKAAADLQKEIELNTAAAIAQQAAATAAESDRLDKLLAGFSEYRDVLDEVTRAELAAKEAADAYAHSLMALEEGIPLDALRDMAEVIDPAGESIFDTNEELRAMLDAMYKLAEDSPLAGFINEIVNSMGSGERSIQQAIAALIELRKLHGAAGPGALGDIDSLINALIAKMNGFKKQQEKDLGGMLDPLQGAIDQVGRSIEKTHETAARAAGNHERAIRSLRQEYSDLGAAVTSSVDAMAKTPANDPTSMEAYRNRLALYKRGM